MSDMILGTARLKYRLKKKISAKNKALIRTMLDEVCNEIPGPACDSIVRHWSQAPSVVEFRDDLIPGSKPMIGGLVRDRGRLVIYRHDYLLRMHRNLAKALLAHELAHVFVCSNVDELHRIKAMAEKDNCCKIPFEGTWDEFDLDPDDAENNFRVVEGKCLIIKESYFLMLNEKRVRQINREWGFDDDGLS